MPTDYLQIIKEHVSIIDSVMDLFEKSNLPNTTGAILLMHMLAQTIALMAFESEVPLKEEIDRVSELTYAMAQLADVVIRKEGR